MRHDDSPEPLLLLPIEQQIELLGSSSRALSHAALTVLKRQGQAILDHAVRGLDHPNPKIRRCCADLMDHLGDDRCIEPLVRAASDAVPRVRRQAIHSLSCQRCKSTPLQADLAPLLIERVLTDPSLKVRQEAAFGLSMQPPDARAIAVLEHLVTDLTRRAPLPKAERLLLRNARFALKRQRAGTTPAADSCQRDNCFPAAPNADYSDPTAITRRPVDGQV